MGIFTFLGISAAIAYGIKSEHKSSVNKSKIKRLLEERNYDIDVNRDFEDILWACNIKKDDSHTKMLGFPINELPSVWPKHGYMAAMSFLEEQPNLTQEDIDLFIKIYNSERFWSLRELQKVYDEIYEKRKKNFNKMKLNDELIIYEKHHWAGVDIDQHRKMVDDIYYNTYWNKIATKPAKIIQDGHKRREIWQVRKYHKVELNNDYLSCQNKCGYFEQNL